MQSALYFCPEVSDIKFHEKPSNERRVDNMRTDIDHMTKAVGAFRECSNVPKMG
jgi:hypothetical protein